MTILEKRSKVRVQALIRLVTKGEYSPEYALDRLDQLNLQGLLVASDYDETFDYLVELMEEEMQAENVEELEEENVEGEE